MKSVSSAFMVVLLSLPNPVRAVLLDCEINAQRIYTCIEVGDPATAAQTPDGTESYSDEYRRYIEQAKEQCVYNEPRRRAGGKNTGNAFRIEQLKLARKKHEQCVSETARELWLKNNPSGAAEPGQDK